MKKELKIVYDAYGFRIHYEGGGQLPEELKGLYTSHDRAQNAINSYKINKPKPKAKEKVHANKQSES